ncbi:hypothetical protein PAAG_12028 [Paracoccidioides lutzii Pb01]|uniref:Uncharacterized protein n=1 Tax=Paracoccidioides lutzii (strain ATCC MYA-826 / Pb01) TaxID=502779 RepID=A0A0A2V4I3_PARBA|nr:hypothetical protein PAAG_12028 [Paracoccidioides lutzii Pb01]KGQ01257.1 hypothetical protein PAAG_12028 [Paracoccidioides lutzii Pb01]
MGIPEARVTQTVDSVPTNACRSKLRSSDHGNSKSLTGSLHNTATTTTTTTTTTNHYHYHHPPHHHHHHHHYNHDRDIVSITPAKQATAASHNRSVFPLMTRDCSSCDLRSVPGTQQHSKETPDQCQDGQLRFPVTKRGQKNSQMLA